MRCSAAGVLLSFMLAISCGGGEKAPVAPQPEPVAVEEKERCLPLPEPGSPCDDAGYCVIDWGEPCGRSSALWCIDGVWVIEEEANLCDEDM